MLFDKKKGALCKHLVFSDTVLYNNEVFLIFKRNKPVKNHPFLGE